MKKLKLPVSKLSLSTPDRLSMDEYWRFVKFGFKYRFKTDIYGCGKDKEIVVVPFKLKKLT